MRPNMKYKYTVPMLLVAAALITACDHPVNDSGELQRESLRHVYYRNGPIPPVVQLGFVVHEIGHNEQFAMDFDAERQDEILQRNVFVAEQFHDLVAKYGWTTVDYEPDPETEFKLFRPQYISPDAYGYLYYNETPEEWTEWLAEIFAEVGEDDYLTDPRLHEIHALGDYSLSRQRGRISDSRMRVVHRSRSTWPRHSRWLRPTSTTLRPTTSVS